MNNIENVYDVYFNKGNSQLYMSTYSSDENFKPKGTRIFSLNVAKQKLTLLYSGKEASAIKFINDSTLLKLSENQDQQSYEFTVCQY